MKTVPVILKTFQTGGIFGMAAVISTAVYWHGQNPESVSFYALFVSFFITAFTSTLALEIVGEHWRALQGAVGMLVLIVLKFLFAPMVIR